MRRATRRSDEEGASFEALGLGGGLIEELRPMERGHHHQEIELNLVFSGAATYLHGGAMQRVGPGRLVVFWGAVPHAVIKVEPGTSMCWMTVPLMAARSWGLPADFWGRLLGGEWLEGPEGSGARFPVRHWLADIAEASAAGEAAIRCELQGCLRWLAWRLEGARPRRRRAPGRAPTPSSPSAPEAGGEGLGAVEKMARHMAEHVGEPLRVERIAAAAGCRPNHAMALFRRRCGLTIGEYLARLRVTLAQRLLLESDAKVTDVAFACGFGTVSAFYANFVRLTGMPPRSFRMRGRSAA
jgi:AraC-like DNA-binding protein